MILAAIAMKLIVVTGPAGNTIEINPDAIASLRQPRQTDELGPKTKCVVFTTDGRLVGAQETCEQIKDMVDKAGG